MKGIEEMAERLGLSERVKELQFLATDFKTVELEGIAPFENELQNFNLETQQHIRDNWETKLAKNPKMFAGSLATIKEFRVESRALKFHLQRSRFDIYDALKGKTPSKLNLEQKYPYEDLCLPLSMGAVTVTAPDQVNPTGMIIFGIRSKNTAFGGESSSTLPAGYFDPDSDALVIGDPELNVRLMSIRLTAIKELREEIGLQDYRTFEYLGLIYDGILSKHPLIALRLGLVFTAEEVRATAHDMGHEVASYHFIPNTIEAVKEFIGRYPSTPHSIARLILHFAKE